MTVAAPGTGLRRTPADPSRIVPHASRAGIGWRCRACGSIWSGARADHSEAQCSRVQRMTECGPDCDRLWTTSPEDGAAA